jgi:plastocyanin
MTGALRRSRIHACLGAALLLSALSPASAELAPDAVQVTIAQHRFIPQRVVVKAGGTVTWTNAERRVGHQVRSRGRDGFASPILMTGQSWSISLAKAGRYDYDCLPHPEMLGSIEVVE